MKNKSLFELDTQLQEAMLSLNQGQVMKEITYLIHIITLVNKIEKTRCGAQRKSIKQSKIYRLTEAAMQKINEANK